MDHRTGRRVLRFAVTGALLGGGVALAGCPKETVNPGPTQEPAPEDDTPVMVNQAMEEEPPAADDGATDEEAPEEPEGPHVNPGPQG